MFRFWDKAKREFEWRGDYEVPKKGDHILDKTGHLSHVLRDEEYIGVRAIVHPVMKKFRIRANSSVEAENLDLAWLMMHDCPSDFVTLEEVA